MDKTAVTGHQNIWAENSRSGSPEHAGFHLVDRTPSFGTPCSASPQWTSGFPYLIDAAILSASPRRSRRHPFPFCGAGVMIVFPANTSRESSRASEAAVRPTAVGDESWDHVSCEPRLVFRWASCTTSNVKSAHRLRRRKSTMQRTRIAMPRQLLTTQKETLRARPPLRAVRTPMIHVATMAERTIERGRPKSSESWRGPSEHRGPTPLYS